MPVLSGRRRSPARLCLQVRQSQRVTSVDCDYFHCSILTHIHWRFVFFYFSTPLSLFLFRYKSLQLPPRGFRTCTVCSSLIFNWLPHKKKKIQKSRVSYSLKTGGKILADLETHILEGWRCSTRGQCLVSFVGDLNCTNCCSCFQGNKLLRKIC